MVLRWAVKSIILPPGSIILSLLLVVLLWRRRPGAARTLLVFTILFFWACSAPIVVDPIVKWHQNVPVADVSAVAKTQAIVILSEGSLPNAREYQGIDQVNRHTLIRVRYGAHLARATGVPVLVSGGGWPDYRRRYADLMAEALAEYGVKPRWREDRSLTTWDNAVFSADLLLPEGVQRITLVTQAYHMRRSVLMFKAAGFDVLPAPTDFLENLYQGQKPPILAKVLQCIPDLGALVEMMKVIHELLGCFVYWVKLTI